MKLLLTTVPGLEDIVINEVREKISKEFNYRIIGLKERSGRVLIELPRKISRELLVSLRSVEKIYQIFEEGYVGEDKNSLERVIESIDLEFLTKYITPNTTMAVKCTRIGNHKYTSLDVASIMGRRVLNYFKTRLKYRPVVNLDNPDLTIILDVIGREYFLGIELTRQSLRNRPYRTYIHEASINPIIAYAMNKILNCNDGEDICDPLCGSGTIPIEGCYAYKKSTYTCIDIDKNHIKGARVNAEKAKVIDRINFINADSLKLSNIIKKEMNIITNPPFGIRIEPIEQLKIFYEKILQEFKKTINSKKIVIITIRRRIIEKTCQKIGLEILHKRTIEQGGLYSTIFVLVGRR